MQTNEFPIFQSLLSEVHRKAFGELPCLLSHSKALALSWFIEESTGEILSYKTLGNFSKAALHDLPASVNPNMTTLAILIRYVQGIPTGNDRILWYRYCMQHRQQPSALPCARPPARDFQTVS
ncbi:MAG: hypothetical protein IPH12_13465 [Saprospirales bacterium]|nr:hypothetical protein [Saprospirales bacterium]